MQRFLRFHFGGWFSGALLPCAWLFAFSFGIEGEGIAQDFRVGASAVTFEADDGMVIAGGITAGKANGQEGALRAVAVVLEHAPVQVAIVTLDVLMLTRQDLDPVLAEIERVTQIPSAHVLVNCTHTHHAPSTVRVHDYGPDAVFTERVKRGLVESVRLAQSRLAPSSLSFALGKNDTVGQNSRMLLDDGQIYWIGPRTNVVRPTGPFDPDLPVFAFRDPAQNLQAVLYNHSTHTIGVRTGGRRSPSIYGLAAQELEKQWGGVFSFLEGASGSTHNLNLTGAECVTQIKATVETALAQARPARTTPLASRKRAVSFRVRTFDDAAEDAAVRRYVTKYAGPPHDEIIRKVFQNMRRELSSQQGQPRETWVQAMRIGDLALVGVPAEYFTQLGLDIKNRSPFRHTYVAELANDWIGYLPNLEGHKLGGYQVWTGYHSYAEPGTGERIAEVAVELLKELARP